jgi:hypothetical protein
VFRGRGWGHAASVGAASAGLLWLVAALVARLNGGQIIAARVAVAMYVQHSLLLVLVTGAVAAIAGALGGAAGYAVRTIVSDR